MSATAVTAEQVLAEVLRAIPSLRYGSVQVIVQNRRVVQIDTLEKKRFAVDNEETHTLADQTTGRAGEGAFFLVGEGAASSAPTVEMLSLRCGCRGPWGAGAPLFQSDRRLGCRYTISHAVVGGR